MAISRRSLFAFTAGAVVAPAAATAAPVNGTTRTLIHTDNLKVLTTGRVLTRTDCVNYFAGDLANRPGRPLYDAYKLELLQQRNEALDDKLWVDAHLPRKGIT